MNKHIKNVIASMEVINYQHQSLLFKDINIWVERTRLFASTELEGRSWLEKIFKSNHSILEKQKRLLEEFENIVRKHTNLNFKVSFTNELNAFAVIPIININSSLIIFWKGMLEEKKYNFKKIKDKGIELNGMIDLENSKVSGVFKEIKNEVSIGSKFFFNKNFTNEEITSIIIHEIGHIFSWFEHVPDVVSTNMAILSATREWTQQPKGIKIELIESFNSVYKINNDGIEIKNLADIDSPEVLYTVLLKKASDKQYRSTVGSGSYDISSIEFLADQFASRHGCGQYLASGLKKMYGLFDKIRTQRHLYFFFLFEIFNLIFRYLYPMIKGYFSFYHYIFLIIEIFVRDPDYNTYDTPRDRLIRIKNDQIQMLKDSNLTNEERATLNNHFESIDLMIKKMRDNEPFFDKFAILISSRKRNQRAEKIFQQELEQLINSSLYADSSRFSILSQDN